jgi:hypothetical protein
MYTILFLYVTLHVCQHVSIRVDHHRGISYIEHALRCPDDDSHGSKHVGKLVK